ncbi:MAG: FAD-dependent monooxygenase [Pikeienuella sp.]
MRALVAGGGVGGLSAALALVRAGWEARVFERAGEIREVGAGLQLGPNGLRALETLGVAARIETEGFEPQAIEMRRGATGRLVARVPLGGAARRRWGAPYIQVHRADLIAALRDGLETALPGAVETGAEVVGYEECGAAVALRLADGREMEGDLIIGADGLRSALRARMLGPEAPRFTGHVAWRATIPVERLKHPPAPAASVWTGRGRHAVTYPLRNGSMLNFVGLIQEDWRREGWTEPGDPARLRAEFAGWAPGLRDILDAIKAPFRWALFDRPPLPRWSSGRVTLLGDACHPMLPSLAQGAAQALEDDVALAARLGPRPDDIPGALRAHYQARIARVTRIQTEARANLTRFHRDDPVTRLGARLIARTAPGWFQSRLDWLYSG